MSRSVFVDTSAWYALADAGDEHHNEAAHSLRRLLDDHRTLITTNHVVSEAYTLLRVRLGFGAAQEFLRRIRSSAFTERLFIPESWEEAAEDLLAQYHDQDFSYVDATSFIVMRHLRLQEALAYDRHFAVLGFAPVAERVPEGN